MSKIKVTINCAVSVDGKIASPSGKQVRISSEEDMKRVYHLRDTIDAVLVGIGTVLQDDPKLTVKQDYVSKPHQPIRIVLDAYCRTPEDALVVNNVAKTIIVIDKTIAPSKSYGDHVSIISVPSEQGFLDLHKLLDRLQDLGISSLLVEGGGTVIWNFLKNRLVDELYVYIGSMIIGGWQTPTMAMGEGFAKETEFLSLDLISFKKMGDGVLLHYRLL